MFLTVNRQLNQLNFSLTKLTWSVKFVEPNVNMFLMSSPYRKAE